MYKVVYALVDIGKMVCLTRRLDKHNVDTHELLKPCLRRVGFGFDPMHFCTTWTGLTCLMYKVGIRCKNRALGCWAAEATHNVNPEIDIFLKITQLLS